MNIRFSLSLIILLLLVSSCDKEDSSPESILSDNGLWTPVSIVVNGVETYEPCNADDLWDFQSGGILVLTEGANICPGGGDMTGTWSITADGSEFTYDLVGEFTAEVLQLNSSVFEFSYSISVAGFTSIVDIRLEKSNNTGGGGNDNSPSSLLINNSPWSPTSIIVDGTELFDVCLNDNTWRFNSGGVLEVREGSNVCPGGGDQNGTWSVNTAGTEYTFDIVGPFTTNITILTANVFEYTYTQSFGGSTTTSTYRFEN